MKSASFQASARACRLVLTAMAAGGSLGCAASHAPTGDGGRVAADPGRQADGAPRLKVVNAYCPVAGTHPVDESGNKMTTADLTREWNGQRVGFCCDGCPPFWDEMTDAERREKLDAALRLEREGGPKPPTIQG